MIDTLNLYSNFVMSDIWHFYLNKIREVSTKLADVVNQYGIGTKVNLDGYNFESGQLLDEQCANRSVKLELDNRSHITTVLDILLFAITTDD